MNVRIRYRRVLLLALLIMANAVAADLSMRMLGSPQNLAFARYIASLQKRDPFTESGPVLISIDASLPKLYKEATCWPSASWAKTNAGNTAFYKSKVMAP